MEFSHKFIGKLEKEFNYTVVELVNDLVSIIHVHSNDIKNRLNCVRDTKQTD